MSISCHRACASESLSGRLRRGLPGGSRSHALCGDFRNAIGQRQQPPAKYLSLLLACSVLRAERVAVRCNERER
jgi:hypothetical protein